MKRFCKKGMASIILATLLVSVACDNKSTDKTTDTNGQGVVGSETSSPESDSKTDVPAGTRDMLVAAIQSDESIASAISKVNLEENIEAVEALVVTDEETALVRVPLEAGITAKEVDSAYLRLKITEGENPKIQARQILNVWDRLQVSSSNITLSEDPTEVGSIDEENKDWYVIDVTSYVKSWLAGDVSNYGIALEETEGNTSKFYSPFGEDTTSKPELVISYAKALEGKSSPYTYMEQEDGNCLSFALRDTNSILDVDLNLSSAKLQTAFNEGGMDNTLDYVKNAILEYVDTNAESLKVKSFRELSSFSDEINPETEYRIAFRIALYTEEGLEELTDAVKNPFDFHLQVQLEDGSWAEKFGPTTSRIVPGSNRDLDPSLFNWDASSFWGAERWTEYYNSNVVFFAVEKSDLTEFTQHIGTVNTEDVN